MKSIKTKVLAKKHLYSTPRLLIVVALCALLGVGLIIATSADNVGGSGKEFYVSTAGTDTNNTACGYSNPCATVMHVIGLNSLAGGSTINLMAGTYPRQSTFYNGNHSIGSQLSSQVTIEPFPGATVTVGGFDLIGYNFKLENLTSSPGGIHIEGHNLTVDHLNIDGGAKACAEIPMTDFPNAAIVAQNNCPDGTGGMGISGSSTNITITNSYIHDTLDKDGLDIGDGGDPQSNLTISGNRFQYLRTGPKGNHEDCMQFYGGQDNVNISNNFIDGCSNSEIFMVGSFGNVTNVNVHNNMLISCYAPINGGQSGTGGCGYYTTYNQTQGYGTCITPGVTPCHTQTNISYTNNTILGDSTVSNDYISTFSQNIMTGGFGYENCASTGWLTNSLVGKTPQKQYCPNGLGGSGNIIGSAAFVDPTSYNYSLASSSPGKGWGAQCPVVDIQTCPLNAGVGPTSGGPTPPTNPNPAPTPTPKPNPVPAPPINGGNPPISIKGKYKISPRYGSGSTVTSIDGKSSGGGIINTDDLSNGIHIITAKTGAGIERFAVNVANPVSLSRLTSTAAHNMVQIISYVVLAIGTVVVLILAKRLIRQMAYRVMRPHNLVVGTSSPQQVVSPDHDSPKDSKHP